MTSDRDTTTFSVTIDRPPAEVFAYVSEITRHGDWSSGPFRIEPLADGPVAVGRRYRSFGTTFGRRFQNEVEITELEAPKRFGFSAKTQLAGTFKHTFVLTPTASGVQVDRIIDTPKQRGIVGLLVRFPIARRQRKTLRLLKLRLESPPFRSSQSGG